HACKPSPLFAMGWSSRSRVCSCGTGWPIIALGSGSLLLSVMSKNDQIDAGKIARLLRGGTLPQAYVYPAGMPETRHLFLRRHYLMHQRAEAMGQIQDTNSPYNLDAFGKKLSFAANRAELAIADRFADPSVRKTIEIDLALIDQCDELLGDVELYLTRTAKG